MPNYLYRAVDGSGASITGVLAAGDELGLENALRERGYWLIEANEQAQNVGTPQRKGKVTRRDLIDLSIHMGTLLSVGVPLVEALRGIEEEASNPVLQAIIGDVRREVEAGASFSEAAAKYPQAFPHQVASMIRAGEQSGTLPETFAELRRYLEWLDRLMGDIKQASIYPTIVFVVVLMFVLLLFTFVIPKFVAILNIAKVPLPLLTVVVIAISDFMVATWWLWPFVGILTVVSVKVARHRWLWLAYAVDRLKLEMPIFGDLNKMIAMSRFATNFSVLYRSGIPILECLKLCQGLVDNKLLERALAHTEQVMAEGVTMSASFHEYEIFPPLVLRMVAVGETSGEMDKALSHVSAYYNEEIPRRIKKVFGILEPAITVMLLGIVATVALAVFLPLLRMMGSLR